MVITMEVFVDAGCIVFLWWLQRERVLALALVSGGYSCRLSVRTGSWSGLLGQQYNFKLNGLWLDQLPGPLLVGCAFPWLWRKEVADAMNIKLSVDCSTMAMGTVTERAGQNLRGVSYLVEPVKGLVVKPCLLTLEVFCEVATRGEWESRLGVKVYTSTQSLIKLVYQPCSRSRAARCSRMIRT